jgi:hypothetical protein
VENAIIDLISVTEIALNIDNIKVRSIASSKDNEAKKLMSINRIIVSSIIIPK